MKYSMFVFEGPECTGKTSICNRLANEFSGELHKRVVTKNEFNRLFTVMQDIQNQRARTSVGGGVAEVPRFFDRWQLISDLIYSNLYHSESIFWSLLDMLLDECEKAGIRIYILMVPLQTMIKRFEQRGDLLVTEQEAVRTYRLYEQLYAYTKNHPTPCLRLINLDGYDMEEAYEYVKSIVRRDMEG